MKDNKFLFEMLPNFSVDENWGDYYKMNPNLLVLLQKIRDYLGHPIHINCGYEEDGHSAKSQHYLGNAVDFHVKGMDFLKAGGMILDCLETNGVADLTGFGVYPFWNTAGFHLDCRGQKARWGRLEDGTYTSIEITIAEMKGSK